MHIPRYQTAVLRKYRILSLTQIYFKISSFCSWLVQIQYNWTSGCFAQRDSVPTFCYSHKRQRGRLYCQFSNLSQYQLTLWGRHALDVFSAVVAFREGTIRDIDNAHWISNADLWWLFVVRLNKLMNKQSSCWWFETQCHQLIVSIMAGSLAFLLIH